VTPDVPEEILFRGHPSWRSMLGFHLKGLAAAIGLGVVAGLISALVGGRVGSLWVVAAVLVVFVIVLAKGVVRCRRTTYALTTRRLAIEIGLLSRDVHEARLEQIQNVATRQSAFERLLGIGTVAFDTAGGAGYEFCFRGVAEPRQIVRALDAALHERPVFDRRAQARGLAQ
jgi:uncharacterized membrane protein YdbT with pleckstrin-like domain